MRHDYIISDAPGALVRADINAALGAVATNNSGAGDPPTVYAGQWILDTTAGAMRLRSLDNLTSLFVFGIEGASIVFDGGVW